MLEKLAFCGLWQFFWYFVYIGHKDCKDGYLISSDTEAGRKLKKTKKMEFSIRAWRYLRHECHQDRDLSREMDFFFFYEQWPIVPSYNLLNVIFAQVNHREPVLQDSNSSLPVVKSQWQHTAILVGNPLLYGWNRLSKRIFNSMVLFHMKQLNCLHEKETSLQRSLWCLSLWFFWLL